MKYLKSYNESIKDSLKPKSTEEILKSLDGNKDKDIYIKFLENGIDVPNEIKNRIKRYITIYSDIYDRLYKKDNIISFTDEEKVEIDKLIHKSKNKDNYYEYNSYYENKFISLFINGEDEQFKIDKFKDYILIIYNMDNGYDEMITRGQYVCQNIDQLLEFIDDNSIYGNKRN